MMPSSTSWRAPRNTSKSAVWNQHSTSMSIDGHAEVHEPGDDDLGPHERVAAQERFHAVDDGATWASVVP